MLTDNITLNGCAKFDLEISIMLFLEGEKKKHWVGV